MTAPVAHTPTPAGAASPGLSKPGKAYESVAGSRPRYMLSFQFRSGELIGYSYVHLARVALVNSELLMEFGGSIVKIQGKGLKELAEKLFGHEVATIYEGGKSGHGPTEVEIIKLSLLQKARETKAEPAAGNA